MNVIYYSNDLTCRFNFLFSSDFICWLQWMCVTKIPVVMGVPACLIIWTTYLGFYASARWNGLDQRVTIQVSQSSLGDIKAESHCNDNEKNNAVMVQRECILLAQLLHAEYAHAHSTNRIGVAIVIVLLVLQCDSALTQSCHHIIFIRQAQSPAVDFTKS